VKEAPLFVQTYAAARWMLDTIPASSPIGDRIHRGALDLLDHIVLALKNFDREQRVEEADECNALLRVHVRLAHDLGLLDERRMLYIVGELDEIGRQLGGWLRRLSAPAR